MFVALFEEQRLAVSAAEVGSNQIDQTPSSRQSPQTYRCLHCGSELQYTRTSAPTHTGRFIHTDRRGDCFNDGNVSSFHRLAQEAVVKKLVNWLPGHQQLPQVDFERHIGSASEFVIADVRARQPVQVAVEIINQNKQLGLSRRLSTLFDRGYQVMYVRMAGAAISEADILQSINPRVPLEIGHFDPQSRSLTFGSVLCPDMVDLARAA